MLMKLIKDTKINRKKLHGKLWSLKSQLVRIKAKGICYTCGTRVWNEERGENDYKAMQAGHFRHGVLDFDEMNIKSQCKKCNHYLSGNLAEYSRRLIRDHGLEVVEELHRRADNALKGELHTVYWYLDQIELTKKELQRYMQ